VIVVGLSHKSAPIEVRERLAIPATELPATLDGLRADGVVAEAVLLSTCNRVEIYAAARDGNDDAVESAVLRRLADLGGREVMPHLLVRRGNDAVIHLFRVASSLDSLVVGEPQILGQLKEAVRVATEAGAVGPKLRAAMNTAVQVAKRVRTDTQIGSGQVSVSSVAVDLARQIFEDLSRHKTLLVGAGDMAEAAARLLARAGAEVLVVNRSPARAEMLATAVGGRPLPWEQLTDCIVAADIVVSSTSSSGYVIGYEQLRELRRKRRGRSLFLIDIAVPRDIDPRVNELENVYLYDIDDLSHVVAQSLADRHSEAERAEAMVLREARGFETKRAQQTVSPVVVALRERTRGLLLAELERSCKGRLKHLADKDKEALAIMVDAAVNKMLHAPTRHLKQLAENGQADDAAHLVQQLFELELKAEPAEAQDDELSESAALADESGPEARVAAR
jgi:glutamyl-tRNA reductase